MEPTAGLDPRDVVSVCARLFEVDLDARSDVQLADDLRDLQLLRNMVDGEFVRRLAVFDARGSARADHSVSTKSWLRTQLRLSPSAASGHVGVARFARDRGALGLAMTCGDISYEHATAVERAVGKLPEAAKKQAEELLSRAASTMHRVICRSLPRRSARLSRPRRSSPTRSPPTTGAISTSPGRSTTW